MKDEIKEILDIFTKYKDDWYSAEYILKPKQCVILYDYITNLQNKNKELKEENKRIFSKVNDDELLISNAMNYAEAQDYKSRCEKAIEYIHNHQLVFELSSKKQIQDWFDMFYKDSLNILNGEYEER